MKSSVLHLVLILFLVSVVTGAKTKKPARKETKETKKPRHYEPNFAQSQTGRVVQSLTASQTVGRDGPVLLSDTNLVETLTHFNRERIPERPAHAKGVGAFGEFEVTHAHIRKYCKASLFSRIGKRTKIFIRFSTVGGELGSADVPMNPPDPRGFAIKFYTDEGIWDLAGNNLAVFPINDPLFFPSLLRSRKRNPRTHLPDATAFWDFTSLRPESTFHTVQLFSDLGYPDGVRFMDGAGVHTFKLINGEGLPVFAKFHHISQQGSGKNVSYERGMTLHPDYSIKDLRDAIDQEQYPSWHVFIQVMTLEQAAESKFNPFDITKIWPEDQFPMIPVGKFILNENPTNYFAQVEMAAFDPGNMVPGIEPSPDRMLQSRMFAYSDAQRYRLGANFLQIQVNRPTGPKFPKTYHRDGSCYNENNNDNGPDYFPNSFGGPTVDEKRASELKYTVMGDVDRVDIGKEDNFSQATNFYNKLPRQEQLRMAANLGRSLAPADKGVRMRALANFEMVHAALVQDIMTEMRKFKM